MSTAARARQRQDRRALVERVVQAHDALHKDDVDGAHGQLHAALGIEERDLEVEPLADGQRFDAAFRALCRTHGVVASYVRIFGAVDSHGRARLVSGGDADLCALVDRGVRRGIV